MVWSPDEGLLAFQEQQFRVGPDRTGGEVEIGHQRRKCLNVAAWAVVEVGMDVVVHKHRDAEEEGSVKGSLVVYQDQLELEGLHGGCVADRTDSLRVFVPGTLGSRTANDQATELGASLANDLPDAQASASMGKGIRRVGRAARPVAHASCRLGLRRLGGVTPQHLLGEGRCGGLGSQLLVTSWYGDGGWGCLR